MADWRALHDSWDKVPDDKKKLIEKLFREKPKEKLTEFFEREPYAKKIYENIVGTWVPPVPEAVAPPMKQARLFSVGHTLENMLWVGAGNKNVLMLQALTLITLLSTEIAYYSSQSIAFLDNSLPIKTWLIFLILAAAFGLGSGVYTLKLLKQPKKLDKLQGTTQFD